MYKIKTIALIASIATVLTACNNNKVSFDASGSFEAEETIISSEATGTIKQFSIEEGQTLEAGQTIGYIDSLQLYLKKSSWKHRLQPFWGKSPIYLFSYLPCRNSLERLKEKGQELLIW